MLRMPSRRVQRNLVDVLDENVGPASLRLPERTFCQERECVAMPDAEYVDPIERRAGRTPGPAPTQQPNFMSVRGEAAEDLVQMNLGATRQWVLAILPVHEQDAHYMRPMRRASASRTPFTNLALFTVP